MILEAVLASTIYWQIEQSLPQECRAAAFIELIPCPCGYRPEQRGESIVASLPKLPIEEIVSNDPSSPFIYYGLGRPAEFKSAFPSTYPSIFGGGVSRGEERRERNINTVTNNFVFDLDKYHFDKHIHILKHKVKKEEPKPNVIPLPGSSLLLLTALGALILGVRKCSGR